MAMTELCGRCAGLPRRTGQWPGAGMRHWFARRAWTTFSPGRGWRLLRRASHGFSESTQNAPALRWPLFMPAFCEGAGPRLW